MSIYLSIYLSVCLSVYLSNRYMYTQKIKILTWKAYLSISPLNLLAALLSTTFQYFSLPPHLSSQAALIHWHNSARTSKSARHQFFLVLQGDVFNPSWKKNNLQNNDKEFLSFMCLWFDFISSNTRQISAKMHLLSGTLV